MLPYNERVKNVSNELGYAVIIFLYTDACFKKYFLNAYYYVTDSRSFKRIIRYNIERGDTQSFVTRKVHSTQEELSVCCSC